MELIMFVALIFMLWLLVQLGVGIYHQGLRRGVRRWARGLPHLLTALMVFTAKLIPLLFEGRARHGKSFDRDQRNNPPAPGEPGLPGMWTSREYDEYINLGITPRDKTFD